MSCSPGMSRCKLGCLHRDLATDYVRERQRQEAACEDMFGQEREDYLARHPLITFKEWLIANAVPTEYKESA